MYEYAAGKRGWTAAGRPTEPPLRAVLSEHLEEAPSCSAADHVEDLRARPDVAALGFCVVLAPDGCVMGLVEEDALRDAPDGARALGVAKPNPRTNRADAKSAEVAKDLRKAGRTSALVTTPEGRLLGFVPLDSLDDEPSPTAASGAATATTTKGTST